MNKVVDEAMYVFLDIMIFVLSITMMWNLMNRQIALESTIIDAVETHETSIVVIDPTADEQIEYLSKADVIQEILSNYNNNFRNISINGSVIPESYFTNQKQLIKYLTETVSNGSYVRKITAQNGDISDINYTK